MPTFDVVPSRKKVLIFKLDKLWVLKHFFDDREIFKALLDTIKTNIDSSSNPLVRGIMPSRS
jgi:hypothetical protein